MKGEAPAAYEEKSVPSSRAGTVDYPTIGVLPRCTVALIRRVTCGSFTTTMIKL
jgi:hypothetical protein